MANDILEAFRQGLKKISGDGVITTVEELKESQFGIPLKHYAQQYLFGATGLRLNVFNSIQGQKEVGKSTFLFDLMGDVSASEEDGGLGGISVLYELEGKISPSILYSILNSHGESAKNACFLRLNHTIESAISDLNTQIVPLYKQVVPKRDKPLFIGFDSIGGAASSDTMDKLKSGDPTGKGYYNKQHFMKYFCENQGSLFIKDNIPVVLFCVNQEHEQASAIGGPPSKVITGGKAQGFKDGHMLTASKKALATNDGNLLTLRTVKTSFCDSRKIVVTFKWNKFGKKVDDAYEAHYLWALASAQCLANPEKGVGDLRDICNVSVSTSNLVTCPQLGLTSVQPEVFEKALFENEDILNQLYVFHKIEKLKDLDDYAQYLKGGKKSSKKEEQEADEPKPKSRSRKKAAAAPEPEPEEEEPISMMEAINGDADE